jgi:hypothetical protein
VAHRVSTLLGAGTGSGAQGSSGGGDLDGQLQVASHRLMLQAGLMRQVPSSIDIVAMITAAR